jgi:preflagellin peptidase FlaK
VAWRVVIGSTPDLLRLLAVPVFGWTAYRDIKTRRVPNKTWLPLAVLAVILLCWDTYAVVTGPTSGHRFFIQVALSLGLVAPLAYGFWLIGGFGGADAKAFILIAVLFPVYPTYYLAGVALPLAPSRVGVFSLTILSNTVLAGVVYPLGVGVSNLARGRFALAMFVGKPVAVERVTEAYGRLLETPDGFTRAGLDLDALRMYLQWRGGSLAGLRADPDTYRHPESLPEEPNPPGDGSFVTDGGEPSNARRGSPEHSSDGSAPPESSADPWGAEQFLDDIDGSAYGTDPETLRAALELLADADEVWVSPGIPFLVPMFAGLVTALVYGDVLYTLLTAIGVV